MNRRHNKNSSSQLFPNGYIVAVPYVETPPYYGIDDDVWPIEGDNDYRKLTGLLGVPMQMHKVQVATLWDETYAYWKRCLNQGLTARLMLVETSYSSPLVLPPDAFWNKLGFDVADPFGKHSIISHQVISPSATGLSHWRSKLNSYGLLDDLESAQQLLSEALNNKEVFGVPASPAFHFVPILLHSLTQ